MRRARASPQRSVASACCGRSCFCGQSCAADAMDHGMDHDSQSDSEYARQPHAAMQRANSGFTPSRKFPIESGVCCSFGYLVTSPIELENRTVPERFCYWPEQRAATGQVTQVRPGLLLGRSLGP
jgi:hypothetical protein